MKKPGPGKRAGYPLQKLTREVWNKFWHAIDKNPPLLENGDHLVTTFLQSAENDIEPVLVPFVQTTQNPSLNKKQLQDIIKNSLPAHLADFNDREKIHRFIMRRVMENLRGKISGKMVSDLLWEYIKENVHE